MRIWSRSIRTSSKHRLTRSPTHTSWSRCIRAKWCTATSANSDWTAPVIEYPHLFIGGKWVAPRDGGTLDSIDPSKGQPWARVAFGGRKDIDAAVVAAREAFGPWSRTPGHERAALLRRFADLYASVAPNLAKLET